MMNYDDAFDLVDAMGYYWDTVTKSYEHIDDNKNHSFDDEFGCDWRLEP